MPKKQQTRGKQPPKTYDLQSYRRQAKKEPFPLGLDEDRVLEIKAPTVKRILDAGKMSGQDLEANLKLVVGEDAYEELVEEIGDDDIGILKPLLKDVQEHFGMADEGESDASSTS